MVKVQKAIIAGFLFALCLVGCLPSAKPRVFEHENFSFVIPTGWKTLEEVWGRPISPRADYYGLGLQEILCIQYPPTPGEGKAFFAVATSPLKEGESLESRFREAYQEAVPEIQEISRGTFEQGAGLSGYEIVYRRPWGEPWWQFRDIWLEKEGIVYVLSFHTYPNEFETFSEAFQQILSSFQFSKPLFSGPASGKSIDSIMPLG